MHPREIRLAAHVSQIQAAVRTGTSEPTIRIYEANPDAVVTPAKRSRLDAYYAELARRVEAPSPSPDGPSDPEAA